MNQMKIGGFIKKLRKEKKLTQEQLSEVFGVSRRTVSRWETGSNLPDLDILIEMADYFHVDLRELFDGERKDDKMDKELEEVVLKVADYSNEEKKKLTGRMHMLFIAGFISAMIYMILLFNDRGDHFIGSVCQGFSIGTLFVGVMMTSKYATKIQALKMKVLRRQK